MYKNTVTPMIAMLDHLEVDPKISDADIETAESNNCRELLENDTDASSILAMIWERVRFSQKDGWNFINIFV